MNHKLLALTTFAILKKPYGFDEVQEFDDRTPFVFSLAESSPGFVARATETDDPKKSNFDRDWGKWGQFAVPRFYTYGRSTGTDQRASTLSVWTDLISVRNFVFSGLHKEALNKRSEWFLKPEWPTYACWWIDFDHTPTWQEACDKLEELHDFGQTAAVFDFKNPFDQFGQPFKFSAIK